MKEEGEEGRKEERRKKGKKIQKIGRRKGAFWAEGVIGSRRLIRDDVVNIIALNTLATMASPCFRTSPFAVQVIDKAEGKCLRIDTFI